MASYTNSGNYQTTNNYYNLSIEARTTAVTGGLLVEIYASVLHRPASGVTPASGTATRSWSLGGGRDTSTSGPSSSSGSSTMAYNFNTTNPIVFYNYFNKYVPYSYGSSTTLSVTISGGGTSSFFTSKTLSVTIPLTVPSTTYTATYNGNNATSGSTSSTSYTNPPSTSGTIANNGFSRTGYYFGGWNTAANGTGTWYYGGDSFTGNLTLYAQWYANYYEINYNSSNGSVSGSGTTSSSVVYYPTSSISTRSNGFTPPSGYAFGGWSTSQDNTADYSAGSGPSVNLSNNSYSVTYYAVWIQTNPVFSESAPYITTTGTLAKNINTNADYTVSASPVTGYSIVYSGSGLNPTSWLSINSSGQLSGVPPTIGTYTFKIRATNNGNNTDTAEISFVVQPPGFRMTGSSTKARLTTAKRFIGVGQSTTNIQGQTIGPDANGYVSLSKMAVYKAGVWVDIANIS